VRLALLDEVVGRLQLLVVVALPHLGGVVLPEGHVRHAQLEAVRREISEDGGLRLDVVLDLEEGEEDDSGVGGEEDEDVPGAVEVGEAHRGPPGTEHPVVDPAGNSKAPKGHTTTTQVENPLVFTLPQLHQQQGQGWQPQEEENEGVDDGLEETEAGEDTGDQEAEHRELVPAPVD